MRNKKKKGGLRWLNLDKSTKNKSWWWRIRRYEDEEMREKMRALRSPIPNATIAIAITDTDTDTTTIEISCIASGIRRKIMSSLRPILRWYTLYIHVWGSITGSQEMVGDKMSEEGERTYKKEKIINRPKTGDHMRKPTPSHSPPLDCVARELKRNMGIWIGWVG